MRDNRVQDKAARRRQQQLCQNYPVLQLPPPSAPQHRVTLNVLHLLVSLGSLSFICQILSTNKNLSTQQKAQDQQARQIAGTPGKHLVSQ